MSSSIVVTNSSSAANTSSCTAILLCLHTLLLLQTLLPTLLHALPSCFNTLHCCLLHSHSSTFWSCEEEFLREQTKMVWLFHHGQRLAPLVHIVFITKKTSRCEWWYAK
jgi:hypothetical protein